MKKPDFLRSIIEGHADKFGLTFNALELELVHTQGVREFKLGRYGYEKMLRFSLDQARGLRDAIDRLLPRKDAAAAAAAMKAYKREWRRKWRSVRENYERELQQQRDYRHKKAFEARVAGKCVGRKTPRRAGGSR